MTKLQANAKQREALEKHQASLDELEEFIRVESDKFRSHAYVSDDVGPVRRTTKSKSSAPRGWTYRNIDDSTVAQRDLSNDEHHQQLSRATTECLEIIANISISRQKAAVKRGNENKRIDKAKLARQKEMKTSIVVLQTEGRTHTVRKFKTTAEKLMGDGKLPKDMKNALDAFAVLAADALGVATVDGDDSTSKITGQYETGGGTGFASRTPSDRQLAGATALRQMAARIPSELREVFTQLIAEEVSYNDIRRRTLRELGEAMGYLHKQSTAAGGATVYCVTALIAHFMRQKQAENLRDEIKSKKIQKVA